MAHYLGRLLLWLPQVPSFRYRDIGENIGAEVPNVSRPHQATRTETASERAARAFLLAHPPAHGDTARQVEDLARVLRVVIREAGCHALQGAAEAIRSSAGRFM